MPDWSQVPAGTRVEFSREYHETHGHDRRRDLYRLGTLKGLYTCEKSGSVNWPQVLWDDDSSKAARLGESSDLAWEIQHPDYITTLGDGLTDSEKQVLYRQEIESKIVELKERRAGIDREIAHLEAKLLI